MRGTTNTGAGYVQGEVFEEDAANDLIKVAVEADDNILAELLALEPPAAVTSTTPRVGFIPLRTGPIVYGDAAARNVNVYPLRVIRSSIDNAKPREMLSGVTLTTTTVAVPAVVGAGLWRLELLYAQLAYVDATDPTKGTTVTLAFAPTAAGNPVAGDPSFASLPANTSTTWNVPIAYVKNIGGATTIANEDILEYPPSAAGLQNQHHLSGNHSGIDARRAFSMDNNHPGEMVDGGASVFAAGATKLTSTVTPAVVGRHNLEHVKREILIPKEITAGTAGVTTDTVIDDSRDWRGANFLAHWILPATTTGAYFGEDDASNGTSATRQAPCVIDAGGVGISSVHITAGQSWEVAAAGVFAGALVAGECQTSTVVNAATTAMGWLAATGNIGLTVDAATGALRFTRNLTGAAAGAPVWCVVEAWFGNHRPL
jgi:hypothetical protein